MCTQKGVAPLVRGASLSRPPSPPNACGTPFLDCRLLLHLLIPQSGCPDHLVLAPAVRCRRPAAPVLPQAATMYRDSKEAALLPKEYAFKVQVRTRACVEA